MTEREALDPDGFRTRQATGAAALDVLDKHLRRREWLVGDTTSVADVGVFAHTHVAQDGLDLAGRPSLTTWLDRIRALPRYANNLVPYPGNARPGAVRFYLRLEGVLNGLVGEDCEVIDGSRVDEA